MMLYVVDTLTSGFDLTISPGPQLPDIILRVSDVRTLRMLIAECKSLEKFARKLIICAFTGYPLTLF